MFVAPSKQNPKDILIDKNHFMDSLTYNKTYLRIWLMCLDFYLHVWCLFSESTYDW